MMTTQVCLPFLADFIVGGWVMATQRRKLYTSSSGDCWYLCRGRDGKIVVSHEPNMSSGGKPSQVDVGTFLSKGNQGPQHQALMQLIGELVNPDYRPAEQFDDHD
jgi:hypothetical protein